MWDWDDEQETGTATGASTPEDERVGRGQNIPVELPSGVIFKVWNQDEADYVTASTNGYMTAFDFSGHSDLRELDAIVRAEMLCNRWDQWLAAGVDYEGARIDIKLITAQLSGRLTELRQQKKALGIDKVTRDKTRGDGSPAQYLSNLLIRARAWGIHRNHQADLAMQLLNFIFGQATAWSNMSPDQRREMDLTAEDILTHVLNEYLPQWRELDDHFMTTEQTYWVADL